MRVDVYAAMQFHGNPYGHGKAAAVLEFIAKSGQRHVRTVAVSMSSGTRNALELNICNAAMQTLVKPCEVVLHIAGDYAASIYRAGWINGWQQAGWLKADGKPPANLAGWKQFYVHSHIHSLSFLPAGEKYLDILSKKLEEAADGKESIDRE